jgi:hypothetical protein
MQFKIYFLAISIIRLIIGVVIFSWVYKWYSSPIKLKSASKASESSKMFVLIARLYAILESSDTFPTFLSTQLFFPPDLL